MVLLSKSPFHAVLYLIISLFGISMIFYTLGSPFLAALEIIVYAGAIMVLFLFVVQMLSPGVGSSATPDLLRPRVTQFVFPGILVAVLLVVTAIAIVRAGSMTTDDTFRGITARELGIALFTHHYLGVKLASLILLIGTIGGMHLGRAAELDNEESEDQLGLR
jgi:NADH-quinone oxidoreductase subunit J